MKTKTLILSLVTSALVNMPSSFAKEFRSLRNIRLSKNRKLEIYPVKFSKTKNEDCLEYNGSCLIPLSRKPVLIEDFKFQTALGDEAKLKLFIDNKASRSFDKLTKKYQNSNLAFVLDGKIIDVSKIKDTSSENSFNMSFNNLNKFESIMSSLKS